MLINSPIRHLRACWRQQVIKRYPVPFDRWQQVTGQLPILQGLTLAELNRLRDLSTLFLHYKSIYGTQDLSVTEEMRLVVAIQAALLILCLDLEDYRGCRTVLLYPGVFVAEHEELDEAGIVHSVRHRLIGESWDTGPVILSWDDVAHTMAPYEQCSNVVIHEFAHQLDMGNGVANGMPPLHRTMNRHAWTAAFSQAYERLKENWAAEESIPLDPYALESPAEFFAVASEAFFVTPQKLQAELPHVYQQLQLYYRQNPANRRYQSR